MTEQLRLLLVQSDPADAERVRAQLQDAGYAVQDLRVDSESALRRALSDPDGAWDFIISDFGMPTLDGLRTSEVLREMGVVVPLLFVSGMPGEQHAVLAMRAGARDYLLMDDLTRLAEVVGRELREAQDRQQVGRSGQVTADETVRLQAALAATRAGLFDFSFPADSGSHVSERWAEILGYSLQDVAGAPSLLEWMFEQVHPEDRPSFRSDFEQMLTGQSDTAQHELRMRHRDRRWLDVSSHAIVVTRGPDGDARRVVGVLLDMAATQELRRRAQQAQKMEALGKLAGGVAHEFNNMLTSIISFTGFVRGGLPPGDARGEDLDEVLAAAERAARLTRQLMLFSRQQPPELVVQDLCAAVRRIESLLRRTIGEDIALHVQIPDWPVYALVDAGHVDQILLNLTVNARDSMPAGGTLTLAVDEIPIDGVHATGLKITPGLYGQIEVRDTGVGMSVALQARIFDPFFTTKGAREGTGLGLATSHGMARELGGAIEVESEPDGGSVFRVLLPRHEGAVVPIDEQSAPTPIDPAGDETILVIEDEAALRRVIARSLREHGYTVVLAEDGSTARELFDTRRGEIDLVFSDVVLPTGNGFDLAEEFRAKQPELPILLTSGYTDRRAMREGASFDVFWKPFTPAQLVRRIRTCLDVRPGGGRGDGPPAGA